MPTKDAAQFGNDTSLKGRVEERSEVDFLRNSVERIGHTSDDLNKSFVDS
jgi:hypothetical protein